MNITKKKQIHRYRGQTSGYQCGEGRGQGQYKGGGVRDTNFRYKISYKGILYNPGNIANILS